MDNTQQPYSSFQFNWTVKLTSHQIRYKKAYDINEIDEVFCSIINAKGNRIKFSELAGLLGFNLQDLAETNVFETYLKGLTEFNLIKINKEVLHLTESGQESLQSKLKYKYFFAKTELFENQTAIGESFNFSYRNVFDLENSLSQERKITKETSDNTELKQKLQFQLFENDIYKGEIIDLYENNSNVTYKTIALKCETFALNNSFGLSIYNSGLNQPEVQYLIDLPENEGLKSELIRKGMFHRILSKKVSISAQDIEKYIDLWNWKELALNPKVDWKDQNVFKLFKENGDGSIWSIISEKVAVKSIKPVIQDYTEHWDWTILTERFDEGFIKDKFEKFIWDFEELSYKNPEFIISLLSQNREKYIQNWKNEIQKSPVKNEIIVELAKRKNHDVANLTEEQKDELIELLTIESLKREDWDWNHLSKNLPNDFIESHIDGFPWDYYEITTSKNEVFKNTFIKCRNNLKKLISKNWNWKFISEKINLNFLYKNIADLSSKINWHIVLKRFFTDKKIASECLKDKSFKSLLKQSLPENFIIAHQNYLWSPELIDFFEELNLIQWETKTYIKGFDTNKNVEWNKPIFEKYQSQIITKKGLLNVSQRISDFNLIEDFPEFSWDWQGISQNKLLIESPNFVKKAFLGEFSFTNDLYWSEILQIITNINFVNNNLEQFQNVTDYECQVEFWKQLTTREERQFLIKHYNFPWDWSFITENSREKTILDSFNDKDLVAKWDWRIATRKLDKEIILKNLEDLTYFIDWEYVINNVFTIENELSMNNHLPQIAACVSVLKSEKRTKIWENLTKKIPFETLFPIIESTYQLDVFQWDWNLISNQDHFPSDHQTLERFKDQINWSILSKSKPINQKFDFNNWSNFQEWFANAHGYLSQFRNYWDWQVLSRNEDLTHNGAIIEKFEDENWDWGYLSEFGGFLKRPKKNQYLLDVLEQFPKIKFEILSKRTDLELDNELILKTKNKNWDWQVLSKNEKAEISNNLILELSDKNWDWRALSKRENIKFTNETILQLSEKNWDWKCLSENKNLVFNADFINKTKEKPWDWKTVSRHKSFLPTNEILTLTKSFDLDWEHLSKHSSLTPTKKLLAKFEDKWYWPSITRNPQINFSDVNFINHFADKWDWRFICESGTLPLNQQILYQFREHLDWNLISSNTSIDFTKEIIQQFKQYWDWTALKENKRVEELLGNYVTDEISKSDTLSFIDKIGQQSSTWKDDIYHFTHIDNAVEIIKNKKIQSRNSAIIKGDAAGSVVHRRNDAHNYARFYFRPQTPTQFYNEFLGKNTTDGYESHGHWVSWYDKARRLGFPKCPIPIFFKFSLQDVLFKNKEKCCISNGNMQTGSTQFGSIEKMASKFGFEDLYYTPEQYATKEDYKKYINYAQQEFLVKNELSFDDLNDFQIVCPTDIDKNLLMNLLGQEHSDVFSKIVVDWRYYNNENPRVRVEEGKNKLHIRSGFNGPGHFVLNSSSNLEKLEILSGNVNKMEKDKIIFDSDISLGNLRQEIKLSFIDESERSWFIYKKQS